MERNYEKEEQYLKAQKKVKDIKAFYILLIVFLCSNSIALFVNLMCSPEFLWSLFSILGCAIALTCQGIVAFDLFPFLDKSWEEKKLKEFMEKERTKNKWE